MFRFVLKSCEMVLFFSSRVVSDLILPGTLTNINSLPGIKEGYSTDVDEKQSAEFWFESLETQVVG